jgi:hypothetical protein
MCDRVWKSCANLLNGLPDLTRIYEFFYLNGKRCALRLWHFCILGGLIALVVIAAFKVRTLRNHEMAFTVNRVTGGIVGPYTQGITFFNPATDLVRFDRTYQGKVLNVSVISFDKMFLVVSISFQYMYNTTQIVPTIFYQFKDENNYLIFLERNITRNIITTCARFNATDFLDKRQAVETRIESDLQVNLNGPGSRFGSDIKALQFKDVKFPTSFNDFILRRQLVDQEKTTALNARPSALTSANTTLLKSVQQAQIITTNSQNRVAIIMANANATAQVLKGNWITLVDSLLRTKVLNGWNNSQVLSFLNQDTWASRSVIADFKSISK